MALLLEDTLHCPSSHHALTMVLAWASEEDGGSVRDEAGGKVPGDLSSQPLLGHLSHLGCDFLPGIACGSVATWGRCQSSWVNDACGRLALGPTLPSEAWGGQRLGWSWVEDPQLLGRGYVSALLIPGDAENNRPVWRGPPGLPPTLEQLHS
uniref:Uncharacterized protein n=1 Tax=Rangifer tarandus platyrhynchus TaxID=3082113 RepID=A0ACB0E8G7_RANTA|nr:unnamed protein product [Rangifer tarandus platyrhynchus]